MTRERLRLFEGEVKVRDEKREAKRSRPHKFWKEHKSDPTNNLISDLYPSKQREYISALGNKYTTFIEVSTYHRK